MNEDRGFWRWVAFSLAMMGASFIGLIGLVMFIPGLIFLIVAVAISTAVEDL